jgi:hypothetical protein
VHQGHQKILAKIVQLARECGGESVVVTFDPHPRQVIYPKDDSLRLLTTTAEKTQHIERLGIDHLVVVSFTVEFSQLSADEYVQNFLIRRFNPHYLVIGYDHRFGLNRQGDINFLRWYSKKAGFHIVEIEKQTVDSNEISSSRIRAALEKGHVEEAARWLGHFYSLIGTVVEGQQLGTKLGFPTANISLSEKIKLVPPPGIYAVFVLHNHRRYRAMLYIGYRPTIKRSLQLSIEVNIFDFDQSIYGDALQIEFVSYLRHDEQFSGLDALREQLKKDKIRAFNALETISRLQPYGKTTPPTAGIVILNFNGKDFLKQFLPSVLGTSYSNLKFWVADNHSSDESVQFLKNFYPNIGLIQLDRNCGFAEGYNRALHSIDDDVDYFVLLNSDVEVTPGWLDPIIDMLEEDRTIAACQPKIHAHREKGKFEYAGASGGWIDILGYPFCRGRVLSETEPDRGQYDDEAEIFWATGAALVIRSKLFLSIGGFDSDYFAHMEEIDLCWRLKKAGFKIKICPRSVVYHVGGGTLDYNTPRKAYLNFRNSLFTIFKNEQKRKLWWLLPLRLVLDGAAATLFLYERKFDHILSILRAHFHFYYSISTLVSKRRKNGRLIVRNRISRRPNLSGIFSGSIIWHFYFRGHNTFHKIVNR